MKQDPFSGVYRALSPKELAEMFMNPNAPKTEAEHWAVREIEKQRAEIERLRENVDRAGKEAERADRLRAEIARVKSDDRKSCAEIKRLRAEIERLLQAIGLVTTTVPDMEIDIENPVGMAQRVVAEVEKLREEVKRLRAKIKWLIEDDERLHSVLYRIANPRPFADCPVEMAQNATRGEHLRREAFDGIRRALEGKP